MAARSTNHVKEEEGYLASLSDLMVGMLFVFIIILMSFALKLRIAESELERKMAEVEKLKEDLDKLRRKLIQDSELREQLLQDIKHTLEEHGVKVELDLKNGILRLPEKLLFDSGSADFNETGKYAVIHLARALSLLLPCYGQRASHAGDCPAHAQPIRFDVILIEGHTDNVPISRRDFADNWVLSMARARNTYEELKTETPGLAEIRNPRGESLFSMGAYADTRPVAPNDTETGRRQNRRIDLRFILATPESGELLDIEQKLRNPAE